MEILLSQDLCLHELQYAAHHQILDSDQTSSDPCQRGTVQLTLIFVTCFRRECATDRVLPHRLAQLRARMGGQWLRPVPTLPLWQQLPHQKWHRRLCQLRRRPMLQHRHRRAHQHRHLSMLTRPHMPLFWRPVQVWWPAALHSLFEATRNPTHSLSEAMHSSCIARRMLIVAYQYHCRSLCL